MSLPMVAAKKGRSFMPKSGWIGLLALLMFAPSSTMHGTQFGTPNKDELAMTSLPGYPGASAVVLEREETTYDDKHQRVFYERIKILTDEGKKYANVSLKSGTASGGYDSTRINNRIEGIGARTIHPDGKIIQFTGKPYVKTLEKNSNVNGEFYDFKVEETVFTLPEVEVGSIIEYTYTRTYSDTWFESPDWLIQGDLYVKQAHYVWYPTGLEIKGDNSLNMSISWFPILPAGVTVQHRNLLIKAPSGIPLQIYELNIKDVPPVEVEEFMPPNSSYTYRVLFTYTEYRSPQEYWIAHGKQWSKKVNSFIGPNQQLKEATGALVAGADTPEAKLHNIYATVQGLENTDFTRVHKKEEDQEAGQKIISATDVLANKRGSGEQLVELFVGMARAVGLNAYVMMVPNRSQRLFAANWLNMGQFDHTIAIVNMEGKDRFFDPGSRYCPYERLSWQHTFVMGLRQTDSGTDFAKTPGEGYASNKTTRIAAVTMADDGKVKGTINISYSGDAGLNWRQRALREDNKSLLHTLQSGLENEVPKGLSVEVDQIENLTDYEQPFKVSYIISGELGTSKGKRVILPADLFMSQATATFPHAKREQPVYFHYPEQVLDAVQIKFPKTFTVEAGPESTKIPFLDMGAYSLTTTQALDSITVRRSYAINSFLFSPKEYPTLQAFYSQFQSKDQETIVLKTDASGTP